MEDSGADPALAKAEPVSRLGLSGFDPGESETLLHKVVMAISTASVPHEPPLFGGAASRSLSYYLGVGIDHFGHDFDRHETLLQKAAEQAIAMIRAHDERAKA